MTAGVVIVGAGQAGSTATITLRKLGYEGQISLVSDQEVPPYELPPLSKDYLKGEKTFDQLLLKPAQYWIEHNIGLVLGESVQSVFPEEQTVVTESGITIPYEHLVWAAGGRPRRLSCPGSQNEGVHVLRTVSDTNRIRAHLDVAKRVVVIGGGYIGLEVAAVLRAHQIDVTIIEMGERLLARVAGEHISAYYLHLHQANGVSVRLNAAVNGLVDRNGKVEAVELQGGDVLPTDLVVAGIGIEPNVEILKAAGANCDNGLVVDEYCRTSLENVFAIGDCAAHQNSFAGGKRIRVESIQNANDQAVTAAKVIMGELNPYAALPWFWSNQYDARLQTVGISVGFDTELLRGDSGSGSFSVVYLKDDRVIALDCVNRTKDFAQGRKLVQARARIDQKRLPDPESQLKDVSL